MTAGNEREDRSVFRHAREALLVAVVIAAGTALRAVKLDATPFWCDEAESSINALTILEQGYPGDAYLGLPIYENTLLEPWQESPEYEFRDSSYSNGMAVYHGWLPLYSIAASFALHGIQPDKPPAALKSRHDVVEQKRRTRAGRTPAVLFGAALLLLVFVASTRLYGHDAGWAALVFGCANNYLIDVSRQARYYSMEVLVTTACCFVVWLMATQPQWKYFLWGGLLFVLMFHTQLLCFATGCLMLLLMVPTILSRADAAFQKLLAFGTIVLFGSLPWIWWTGFYSHRNQIPRGWSLLSLPADIFALPPARTPYLILFAAFVSATAWVLIKHSSWPERWKTPLAASWRPLGFLTVWVVCVYVCFLSFMPAASFFSSRLKLPYWGPMLLGASVICAAIARIIAPRMSRITAPLVMLAIAMLVGKPLSLLPNRHATRGWAPLEQISERVDAMRLDRTAKLFAAPNDHLIYTFYYGLPFQSIMPVRRSFLDTFEGDVVFVDADDFGRDEGPLSKASILESAQKASVRLTEEEASRYSRQLTTRDYRERVSRSTGGDVVSELEDVPGFLGTLMAEHRNDRRLNILEGMMPALMTRGFEVNSWPEWSEVFFYRFVNPMGRRGGNANYARRLRGATGLILMNSHKVIYRCPKGQETGAAGVRFEIVE